MTTRLFRLAVSMMAAVCCLANVTSFDVNADDRAAVAQVWDDVSGDDNRLPVMLTAANGGFSPSPVWNPSLQGLEGISELIDYVPYIGGSNFPTRQQSAGSSLSKSTSSSGSGLDGLPSFRGIKGIKNLPGGVGTLLMANPHVGASWYPEQSTDQNGTTLSMEREYFQGAVPIYHRGPSTYVLTAETEVTTIRTNAILPTTNQPFPSQLFNIAIGMNYFHQFEGGNVGGFVFDVGSASDKPFESGRDILASGTGFLLIPQDEDGSWFLGVNASTNSQVLYGLPIPGGGYFYHPSEDFQAIVGFPFSVFSWKPSRDWQLQYVYAFLTTMHARAVYQPTDKWQIYSGFEWTNENWNRSGRVNEEDHFFYYEKKLATGFLWWFKPHVGLEVSGGWAFDRYFTEVNGFKLVGENTVHIGSGPYVTAQIDLRF
ncbi:hypothetical protein [Schlesneria paludicola]|uniref:hypothetical protein n=1 Tax=Schlesneria paludicola TaxID=360056 RepID=UPI0012FA8C8C|nr:hypothetical protein [Schlesneria paludicola]